MPANCEEREQPEVYTLNGIIKHINHDLDLPIYECFVMRCPVELHIYVNKQLHCVAYLQY